MMASGLITILCTSQLALALAHSWVEGVNHVHGGQTLVSHAGYARENGQNTEN